MWYILYLAEWKYIVPYGTKILRGIKFYSFTIGNRIVKLNSVNFYSINSAMFLWNNFCTGPRIKAPLLVRPRVCQCHFLLGSFLCLFANLKWPMGFLIAVTALNYCVHGKLREVLSIDIPVPCRKGCNREVRSWKRFWSHEIQPCIAALRRVDEITPWIT